MQKLIDYIYIVLFGKYTLDGFAHKKSSSKKYEYILDSVFPDEETMKIALQPPVSTITSKWF